LPRPLIEIHPVLLDAFEIYTAPGELAVALRGDRSYFVVTSFAVEAARKSVALRSTWLEAVAEIGTIARRIGRRVELPFGQAR
jgi:hypothetical protein